MITVAVPVDWAPGARIGTARSPILRSLVSFLGTGMLVDSERVLTCRHVVWEKDPWGAWDESSIPHLLVESVDGRRVAVCPEVIVADVEDLALLTLTAPLAGEVPLFLYGLTKALVPRLQMSPLEVFGFTRNDKLAPRQYTITELLTLPTYQEGTLLDFQFHGGLAEGVSGSPVLVALGDQWAYVGTAYLGGERSASSRIIMADPVLQFLTQKAGLRSLRQLDATRALAFSGESSVSIEELAEHLAGEQDLPIPYRHLAAFREVDAPYFHGRQAETETLLARVQESPPPFVALVGASGSGKSSLVQAGMIPVLRGDPHWRIAICRPLRDPFGELAMALAPLVYPEEDKIECVLKARQLASHLREQKLRFADVVSMIVGLQYYPPKRLLLVIDQFEELYTQPLSEDLRSLFLKELVGLIQGQKLCTVLVTLRTDFLRQTTAFSPFVEVLNTYGMIVLDSTLKPESLKGAIEEPAKQLGVTIAPRLTDRILQDLGQTPAILPLLQFALTELWKQRSQGQLTHTAYDDIGGVHKALATYADRVVAEFVAQEKQLQRTFVQLLRPGEGTEDTRQVATRAQVGDANWPLVCRLADARLVVTGRDEQDQETVEVV